MFDTEVPSEAHIDNEAWDIRDGVDGDIFIVTIRQTTNIDLQIIEEVRKAFVHNTCVSYKSKTIIDIIAATNADSCKDIILYFQGSGCEALVVDKLCSSW